MRLASLGCFLKRAADRLDLHSSPTRRSSDLFFFLALRARRSARAEAMPAAMPATIAARDRKSTRLNSSHLGISYAVLCLKKKKNPPEPAPRRAATRSDREAARAAKPAVRGKQ